MANNYTQFSFAIGLNTPEQVAWTERVVAFLNEVEEDPDAHVERIEAGNAPHEWDALLPEDFEYGMGCNFAVDEDGLWIYAEESGSPDAVIPLVQAYLRKFEPDGHVGFSWADTCSKPRIDEFGGGAVWIGVESVEWMNTYEWLSGHVKSEGT